LGGLVTAGAVGCTVFTIYSAAARKAFSYDGERKLSKQIVEGVADFVVLPAGGVGLDVGCGSGALTIACAKRNPNASMIGIDHWGPEYKDFSKSVCEHNAEAEGVTNVRFEKGDAVKLDFADETFDAVTSNYVYHNIMGASKQELLLETLRVLKKGGFFAIHDLIEKSRYGDMQAFAEKLKAEGYEQVWLIDTTDKFFRSPSEAKLLMLGGSTLLFGKK
jgi:ubiquinone/menaquinone biosynthesis C-methylase UbiE